MITFVELMAILLLCRFTLACDVRLISFFAVIVDLLINKELLEELALTTAGTIKPCKPYAVVLRTVSSANLSTKLPSASFFPL